MVRIFDQLLDVAVTITETGFRLSLGSMKGTDKRSFIEGGAHATSAATCGSFYHHGKANFFGNLDRVFLTLNNALRSGSHRDTKLGCRGTGLILVSHRRDNFSGWADELHVALLAELRKARVL